MKVSNLRIHKFGFLILSAMLMLIGHSASSQIPTFQDCLGARIICQETFVETDVQNGSGNYSNEINPNNQLIDCGLTDTRGIFYMFTVNQSGNFGFLITPEDLGDDFNWMLFDMTGRTCEDLETDFGFIVSCNESSCSGQTGANGGSTLDSQPGGCFTSTAFNNFINVQKGSTYLLFVQNWNSSGLGYTIDFSLSDAGVISNSNPTTSVVQASCNESFVNLSFSQNFLCSSFSENDFTISDSNGTAIPVSFEPGFCDVEEFANNLNLVLSTPLDESQSYTIHLSENLQDICGNTISATSEYSFLVNGGSSCNGEICDNGIDDDNDGLIDCFDDDCCAFLDCDNSWFDACPETGCVFDLEPFEVAAIEVAPSEPINTMQHLVSGDLDGDGTNEIVATTEEVNGDHFLVVLNSVDGTVYWKFLLSGTELFYRIAIADIEFSNSTAEVLIFDEGVKCFDSNGNLLWQQLNYDDNWDNIATADFNEDGLPEVYGGNLILSGQNGSILVDLPNHNYIAYLKPMYAYDILEDAFCTDCDGLEYLFNDKLYAVNVSTGTYEEISERPNSNELFHENFLADWNMDGNIDVLTKAQGELFVSNLPNWDIINQRAVFPGGNGDLCIGNLDQDPLPELTMVQSDTLYALDNDLSILWKVEIEDNSARNGATMFDFNSDGQNEIVLRDENNLRILRGTDGGVVELHPCQTISWNESPIIVDSDDDNEAEIWTVCGTGFNTSGVLTKFVSVPGVTWPDVRSVWNQSNYFNVHINEDLTVPTIMQKHHLVPGLNTFLNQYITSDPIQLDLEIEGATLDLTDCQLVSLIICNDGQTDFDEVLEISFYNSMNEQLIETLEEDISLAIGECLTYAVNVDFDPSVEFFTAVINDNGSLTTLVSSALPNTQFLECDYDNNFLPFIEVLNAIDFEVEIDSIANNCGESTIYGSPGNLNYLWEDNSMMNTLTVTSDGNYLVTVTDACGNIATEEVAITITQCDVEICDNGIDDDGDGLIDCMDSDCCGDMLCNGALPDFSLPNTSIVIPNCQEVFLNICNDGADYTGLLDLAIFDQLPTVPTANLVTTMQLNVSIAMGDCQEVPIDIGFANLDAYYIFLNDNGTLDPPYNMVQDSFPITQIHECDFENNLGFYLPQDFPAVEVNESICEGESFTLPDGEMVMAAGVYMDTIQSNFMCDSIIITDLMVLNDCVDIEDCTNGIDDDGDGDIDIFDEDCECMNVPIGVMDTIYVNGNLCADNIVLSVDNDPMASYQWYINEDPFPNAPTINELDLTNFNPSSSTQFYVYVTFPNGDCQLIGPAQIVDEPYTSTEGIILCPGETYVLSNGTVIDMTGTYVDELTAIDGCDSLATIELDYYPELDLMFNATSACGVNQLQIEANNLIAEIIVDNMSFGTQLVIDGLMDGMHSLEVIDVNNCSTTAMFEIDPAEVEFSLSTTQVVFNCLDFQGTICYDNLAPGITQNTLFYYAVNSLTGELQFIGMADVVLDLQANCTDFNLSAASPFNFENFDQLLVVANANFQISMLNQLDDIANYINECDVTNNYFFIDMSPELTLDLGSDVSICDSQYLIKAPDDFENYQWSTSESSQDIIVANSGEYILTAVDQCDRMYTDTINVELFQLGTITEGIAPSCGGQSSGSIVIDIPDVNLDDVTFIWQDDISDSNEAFDLPSGEYEVSILYGPCQEDLSFIIEELDTTSYGMFYTPNLCFGSTTGFIEILNTDNVETVFLDNEAFSAPYLFEDLSAGTYNFTLIDSFGCVQMLEFIITERDEIIASLPDTMSIDVFDELQIFIEGDLPDDATYSWSPSEVLSCSTCPDPFFIGEESTAVEVEVKVNGCTILLTVFIEVNESVDIYIPNAFSPNGDLNNDLFGPFTNLNFESLDFFIYDRWGNLIHEVENSSELVYWDGRFNAKKVNPGVYVYLINFTLETSEPIQRKGTFTLIE